MAVRLFLEWLDGHPQLEVFKDYFSTQWLGDLQGWYEGFTGCYPSTNNGLEAVNGTLKASYTLRDRLPLPRFLQLTKKVVEEWSFTENQEGFSNCRTIQLSEWTEAYQWTQQRPITETRVLGGLNFTFVKASKESESAEEFSAFLDAYLESFPQGFGNWERYCKMRKSIWSIVQETATTYNCNCPKMLKKGICCHSLGLRILRREVEVPPEAKAVPLGQKRKRGRPAKARRALQLQ